MYSLSFSLKGKINCFGNKSLRTGPRQVGRVEILVVYWDDVGMKMH